MKANPHPTEYRFLLAKIFATDSETLNLAKNELVTLFSLAPFYFRLIEQDKNFATIVDSLPSLMENSANQSISIALKRVIRQMADSQEEAANTDASKYAKERFELLADIRRQIVAETEEKLGYVPRSIAKGLHVSVAFCELALSCKPCSRIHRELHLDNLQKEYEITKAKVADLQDKTSLAVLDADSTGNRFERWIGRHATSADKKATDLTNQLSIHQAKLEIIKDEMDEASISLDQERTLEEFRMCLDGLSEENKLLIQNEDQDDLHYGLRAVSESDRDLLVESDHRMNEIDRKLRQGTLESRRRSLAAQMKHSFPDLRFLGAHSESIKRELYRQFSTGEWHQIEWPELTGKDMSKINEWIDEMAGFTKDITFREAFGLDPILYSVPRSLEKLCDLPFEASINKLRLRHNRLEYNEKSTISTRITMESL